MYYLTMSEVHTYLCFLFQPAYVYLKKFAMQFGILVFFFACFNFFSQFSWLIDLANKLFRMRISIQIEVQKIDKRGK